MAGVQRAFCRQTVVADTTRCVRSGQVERRVRLPEVRCIEMVITSPRCAAESKGQCAMVVMAPQHLRAHRPACCRQRGRRPCAQRAGNSPVVVPVLLAVPCGDDEVTPLRRRSNSIRASVAVAIIVADGEIAPSLSVRQAAAGRGRQEAALPIEISSPSWPAKSRHGIAVSAIVARDRLPGLHLDASLPRVPPPGARQSLTQKQAGRARHSRARLRPRARRHHLARVDPLQTMIPLLGFAGQRDGEGAGGCLALQSIATHRDQVLGGLGQDDVAQQRLVGAAGGAVVVLAISIQPFRD